VASRSDVSHGDWSLQRRINDPFGLLLRSIFSVELFAFIIKKEPTVRSFLGRFVSIGTEPRVDGHREIEECKNVLLHAREGREMTALAAAFTDDGQRQALKRLQQASAVGCGVARFGLPTDNPSSVVLAMAKRWRTPNSSRVSTRHPMDNRRINPVAWSSRSRDLGVSDNGRPFRRPIARSTRDSVREARTASCKERCSGG
jgi:hypothetical protein